MVGSRRGWGIPSYRGIPPPFHVSGVNDEHLLLALSIYLGYRGHLSKNPLCCGRRVPPQDLQEDHQWRDSSDPRLC